MIYWVHILQCSDYIHLFGLDFATTAIYPASFDATILSPIDVHIINIQVLQSRKHI